MNIRSFLEDYFRIGSVAVRLPNGRRLVVGDGAEPTVEVTVADNLSLARIVANPSLGAGEAYMEGALTFEKGTIFDLVTLATRNGAARPFRPKPGPLRLWWSRMVRESNARSAARRHIAHHYDLSIELYRRFLDSDLQYSCALFEHRGMSLEEAQKAKKRHIAAKLLVGEGQRVLDIGCGWGGLALSLASLTGALVHGVTLSSEQWRTATARAEAAGLGERANFSLTDYRDVTGQYDRIVSVGMFEHVGRPNYQSYFDQIARLLADDGIALIHSIGRSGGPSTTDPFTAKYIFPGGYIPALSEVLPAVERSGLRVTDIEILRLHYAETLRSWRERFEVNRAEIAALYDERFCRMWEYYLAGAEVGFRYGDHMVFQMQLAKRVDAVPITRGYIDEVEQELGTVAAKVA